MSPPTTSVPTLANVSPAGIRGESRSSFGEAATAREDTAVSSQRASRLAASAPWLLLLVVTTLLYGRGLTRSHGVFGDSFHHVMNGIFVYDALRDPAAALSNPREFGERYYRHFPAVNLGYYPPGFAVLEAAVMSVFGVSAAAGQLTVFLMAWAMALLGYAWLRLRFEPWWAAGTAIALISTPMIVYWGQDIMLEAPTLALMLGAIWSFERMIRAERPTWSMVMLWALFTSLAILTKQNALLLLGVFGAGLITTGRWRLFLSPRVVVCGGVILLAAAAVAGMTLSVGGAAVGHTLGHTSQHVLDRFKLYQWRFYLEILPDEILTWPTLVLSLAGLVLLLRRWEKYASLLLLWLVGFYVMHSYFKGQTARYACLWLPPFFVFAATGLRHLSMPLPVPAGWLRSPRGVTVGAAVMMLWVGFSVASGAGVKPRVAPDAYRRAAAALRDRLGPFTCMTFLSGQPGRMSVALRLAIEDDSGPKRSWDQYGRILRAEQVLRFWRDHWPDAGAIDESLKSWNVKYLMTERPPRLDAGAGDLVVAEAFDGVLALGGFREVGRWPVIWHGYRLPERTLLLYERIEPMTYDPQAKPPLTLARTAVVFEGEDGSVPP